MGSVRSPRALPDLLMELARGIEPPTCGLQNRCSAVELRQRPRASAMYGSILHYGEHYLACVIARLTQSAEAISLQRWSRGTGLLRFARNNRVGGECGNQGAGCVIVSWLLGC